MLKVEFNMIYKRLKTITSSTAISLFKYRIHHSLFRGGFSGILILNFLKLSSNLRKHIATIWCVIAVIIWQITTHINNQQFFENCKYDNNSHIISELIYREFGKNRNANFMSTWINSLADSTFFSLRFASTVIICYNWRTQLCIHLLTHSLDICANKIYLKITWNALTPY